MVLTAPAKVFCSVFFFFFFKDILCLLGHIQASVTVLKIPSSVILIGLKIFQQG